MTDNIALALAYVWGDKNPPLPKQLEAVRLVVSNLELIEELREDMTPPYTASTLDAYVAFGGEDILTATLLSYSSNISTMKSVADLLISEGYSDSQVRLSLRYALDLTS